MTDQVELWRAALAEFPVESCGRLDMSTTMSEPVIVGRVESDVVRYVYFKDGRECIVLGPLADHVAFRAADYDALATEKRERESKAAELIAAARAVSERWQRDFDFNETEMDRLRDALAGQP